MKRSGMGIVSAGHSHANPTVAVVGLGSMGSMALWQLAARGIPVTGYEQHTPSHARGASAGGTRMFRMLYPEGREYLPLLQRAQALWRDLESEIGWPIMAQVGGLLIGRPDHELIADFLAAADDSGVPHEVLSPAELFRRYPVHRLDDDEIALFDPQAGVLRTDVAVVKAIDVALRHGAEVRTSHRVVAVEPDTDGVTVRTTAGVERFDSVIVSTGPWSGQFLAELGIEIIIKPTVHAWYLPRDRSLLDAGGFPIVMRRSGSERSFGAMPALDGTTIKVSPHALGSVETVGDVDGYDGVPRGDLVELATATVEQALPSLHPYPVATASYTDGFVAGGHPLVGHLPASERVVVLAGFSGHGFKMAPAFGELAALLATGEAKPYGIDLLDPARRISGDRLCARPVKDLIAH